MMEGKKKTTIMFSKINNDHGSFLVVLMIILSIFSILSMAAMGTLLREISVTNRAHVDIIALQAAESGIELAKYEIFSRLMEKNATNTTKSFREISVGTVQRTYGKEHFPELFCGTIKCVVTSHIQKGKVYMESTCQVLKIKNNPEILSEKTVKTLIKIAGSKPTLSTEWKISN